MSDSTLWLFDFDNTLVRLEPEVDWAASRRELEPLLHAASAPQQLFEKFPKGNLLLYDAYRTHLAGLIRQDGHAHDAILRQASEIIEKFELQGVDRATALEGAGELIRSLRGNGNAVGIVTSNSSRTVQRWIDKHQLADSVSVIVGRDSLLPLKPSPEMILRALKLAAVNAKAASYVGDSAADFASAQAAGVPFYGIASAAAARDALLSAGATQIYPSPAALAIHLDAARARPQ